MRLFGKCQLALAEKLALKALQIEKAIFLANLCSRKELIKHSECSDVLVNS